MSASYDFTQSNDSHRFSTTQTLTMRVSLPAISTMSVDLIPTETTPKSIAIVRNEDTNNNVVHVESHTYRTVIVHILAHFNPRLAAFHMPVSSLSMLNPGVRAPLEVSAIVFNAQRDKVLLLQRVHAPNAWELPSCGIMDGEKTALHAVVRTVHQCSYVTPFQQSIQEHMERTTG